MRISDWSSDVCSSDLQPHLFFTSPVPPTVPFHHLRLADLPLLTGAVALHRQGITGRDVRIVLVDSGAWLDHAFFRLSNYNVTVEAAADCPNNSPMDHIGHGTAVRSEERRVGKECVSTCRSRWSRYH